MDPGQRSRSRGYQRHCCRGESGRELSRGSGEGWVCVVVFPVVLSAGLWKVVSKEDEEGGGGGGQAVGERVVWELVCWSRQGEGGEDDVEEGGGEGSIEKGVEWERK